MGDFRQPLLDALATGPKQPADLDEALLGVMQLGFLFDKLPAYGGDMTALVNEGKVRWWRDDNQTVWYEIVDRVAEGG